MQKDKYHTASMYKEIRGEPVNIEWHKMLNPNYARPRARFTLWMALHGKLPTKDRLHKFGIIADGNCTLSAGREFGASVFRV